MVRGWSARSLLDGYEAERRPVAAQSERRRSDVHGSAIAFEAVLAEVLRERPDLVVFGGGRAATPRRRPAALSSDPPRSTTRAVEDGQRSGELPRGALPVAGRDRLRE